MQRLILLVVLLGVSTPAVAAPIVCNANLSNACISVDLFTTTTNGIADVRLDVVAPVGITVTEILIRDLLGRSLLDGSDTYAFEGSFSGAFELNASFELPDRLKALTDLLSQETAERQTLNQQIDQLESRIDQLGDTLASLQHDLDACLAAHNAGCVDAVQQQIQSVLEQIQSVNTQVQSLLNARADVTASIDRLTLELQNLSDDDRFPVLIGNDLAVESWSGHTVADTNSVPEPSSLVLLQLALFGLGVAGWSRRRRVMSLR